MSASHFPVLRPHQLPAPPTWLAGRDTELSALDQMLASPGHGQVTIVISGVPGVGKTALAAWWLHQRRSRFCDGQFHARLAGPHGPGETPYEALGRWLRALGIAPGSVPASQTKRLSLWQAETTGRRLAVMVDDAPSIAAVKALLPRSGRTVVVVTSRRAMGPTSPAGFTQLRLRPLNRTAAISLLSRQLYRSAPVRDTSMLTALARESSGLPLALRLLAPLVARGGTPGVVLGAQLAAEESRLRDRGMPVMEARASAVIEVATRQLDAATAWAFRLLSLCPSPEISSGLAAALLDTSPSDASQMLAKLAQAGLIEPAASGWWHFHDLIYWHARYQAIRLNSGPDRRAATRRMLTWYARAAIGSSVLLPGTADGYPSTKTHHQHQSGRGVDGATLWAGHHQPAMVAALRAAAARGEHASAVLLAGVLWPLLGWCGCYTEQLAVTRHGVRAAQACADAPAEAQMLAGMSAAQRHLGRVGQAASSLHAAARIWLELGRDDQVAATLRDLGRISAALGRPAEASRYYTQAAQLRRRAVKPASPAGGP
jgi:hypothetical protein